MPSQSPRRVPPASPYRDSPRRHRPSSRDVEATSPYTDDPQTPTRRRRPRQQAFIQPPPAPPSPAPSDAVHGPTHSDLGRKKSLVRPERNRIDRDHPNYLYRQHAHNMAVQPSTTGNDPMEDEDDDAEAEAEPLDADSQHSPSETRESPGQSQRPSDSRSGDTRGASTPTKDFPVESKELPRRLQRRSTRKGLSGDSKRRHRHQEEALRPPSIWNVYCALITFWAPGSVLACMGKPSKAQQRAWREKMGLISIILLIAAFVGFLTFGFTQAVCGRPAQTFAVNTVGIDSMIFHGYAYNLNGMEHPAADGIPAGSNVLYDLPHKYGGQDGSFFFQNVNGACKGIITLAPGSDIPTDSDGNLAWYFPCEAFNQDGSSQPNFTDPTYLGYACHLTGFARQAFYSPSLLSSSGPVVFDWDQVRNTSRNLTVFSGSVLDLNLLRWFNTTQVSVPSQFLDIQTNPALRGTDLTHAWATGTNRAIGECLTEIIRVGSVNSDTVGCIASEVVLYVSLVFILSVVLVKFFLALAFQWLLCRRFAAPKSSLGSTTSKKRQQQIEEWADDIYRPPPRLADASNTMGKRSSTFLPTTSRFTSPYNTERPSAGVVGTRRGAPTTMASQSRMSRYGDSFDGNSGEPSRLSVAGSRSSYMPPAPGSHSHDARGSTVITDETSGPRGGIHGAVVPQPPAEWEPFGYPLAHTICLVTAYSEGEDSLRSTLDSIATTEYPNSHKVILVVCDGMVKGHGETLTTPEIALSMMGEHAILPDEVQAFSYVAVASGAKRHSMARVYAGFYDYGEASRVPDNKQQRVPMMVVVKCGTPDEAHRSKPGNRGKRDSQIILMSFLQKVMFDERMTELEFEIFNGLWRITGISPDFYETVLMVDADTKVFPDSLTHMNSAMVRDPEIMGLCGETKIANKRKSWVTMIQVFEYFISHHLSKSFESVFGGVTCLPGCFCMYRIKAPKGRQDYWVPILANPDVVEHYSENVVDTLHKKNLYLLGEDRYLSTLMLKTFPKRKQVFVPQAVCKTVVPDRFPVLLSQRRRWINSTVHNLMELVLVRDLCGTFCFSMQFVVFIELVGTLVLPAAISFTFYLIVISVVRTPVPVIPLILLALILGLPAVLIVLTAHRWSYVLWMLIYLVSLPIWNFVLPAYAYWKFDDFSWGETRRTAGDKVKKAGLEYEGEFDSSKITMKRWGDFEKERRLRYPTSTVIRHSQSQQPSSVGTLWPLPSHHPNYDDR